MRLLTSRPGVPATLGTFFGALVGSTDLPRLTRALGTFYFVSGAAPHPLRHGAGPPARTSQPLPWTSPMNLPRLAEFLDPLRCSIWSRGVTVSTLDSESSDRGSNPRRTFFLYREKNLPVAKCQRQLLQGFADCRNGKSMFKTLFVLLCHVPGFSKTL